MNKQKQRLSNKNKNSQFISGCQDQMCQNRIKKEQCQRFTSKKGSQSLSTSGDQAVEKNNFTGIKVRLNKEAKNRYVQKLPLCPAQNNGGKFYECESQIQNPKVQRALDEKSACQEQRQRKVELCKNFLETGYCQFKARCKFAHGIEQLLKNEDLMSTFKTKKCKTFHDHRQCRFGQRCNFKHDDRNLEQIFCLEKKLKNQKRQKFLNNYPQLLLQMKGQSIIARIIA